MSTKTKSLLSQPDVAPVARRGRSVARVRVVLSHEMSPGTLAAWSALEARALEPNAYLSPHFVMPAIRHLDPEARVQIVLIEGGGPPAELLGVAVLCPVAGTRSFPLPHLVSYRSRHSFLGGLLIDGERATEALDGLFNYLHTVRWRWHGLALDAVWGDGLQAELFATRAKDWGLHLQHTDKQVRAVLVPATDPKQVDARLGSRGKDIRRRQRRLEERGTVGWALHRQGGIPAASVDAFLDLEHLGWKGESGTSLHANPADEAFFREVVAGFGAEDRAFFTELSLDGAVIASTSNFVSGSAGFAFKTGWRPDLAKMSPGVLNEVELMRQLPQKCRDLTFLDSGAGEGSYMDDLWPERRLLVSTVLSSSGPGRMAQKIVNAARAIKRRLRRDGDGPAGDPPTET